MLFTFSLHYGGWSERAPVRFPQPAPASRPTPVQKVARGSFSQLNVTTINNAHFFKRLQRHFDASRHNRKRKTRWGIRIAQEEEAAAAGDRSQTA
jgi:hypothetical protein